MIEGYAVLWPFVKTVAVMFVFYVFYGLCCKAYMSLAMFVAEVICGTDRLAAVTGVLFAGITVGGLIGPPIAGAFLDTIGYRAQIIWRLFCGRRVW